MRRIKVSEAVRGGRGKEGEQHISTPETSTCQNFGRA